MGKERSASNVSNSWPTAPVAPRIATVSGDAAVTEFKCDWINDQARQAVVIPVISLGQNFPMPTEQYAAAGTLVN